jgi:hypothetical protein
MSRIIPSFKIAAVIEEKQWKLLENILKNKNEKKLFTGMFSIANLFISAYSNAVNLIRIHSYHDVDNIASFKLL